ncbi:MAG TPA: hypothetical protein VGI83_07630, partial [Gemmatimonadales bacterium]
AEPDIALLKGADPMANAARLTDLFARPSGDRAAAAAVLLNAGAALYVAGAAADYKGSIEVAKAALGDGAARKVVDRLRVSRTSG